MTFEEMDGIDDAELGRMVKACARITALPEVSAVGVAHAGALQLVCYALEVNATETTVVLKGFSFAGEPQGDWEVLVRKVAQ